jgi:hypothetical protein
MSATPTKVSAIDITGPPAIGALVNQKDDISHIPSGVFTVNYER